MAFQLAAYLDRFNDVCLRKFGRTYNFDHLESHFREHSTGKRILTARDVSTLFNADNSPFAKYWPRPHVKATDEILTSERLYLGPLLNNKAELVQRVLSVFHNLGIASLLLRFAHPGQFGVFSTPVVHVLQVGRPDTVLLYLAYCDELARWRDHFHMANVAKTESALWTYAEIAKMETAPDAAIARKEFDEDLWVQRQRVAQVLRPFFQKYGPLQLARIILDEDCLLAGKIAAGEYERLLNQASIKIRRRPLTGKGEVPKLLEELANRHYLTPQDKVELQRIWETRNKVVHDSDKPPEREEVEVMIDYIDRICVPFESTLPKSPPKAAVTSSMATKCRA